MSEPSWRSPLRLLLIRWGRATRHYFRILNGDDAYTRYRAHWLATHGQQGTPLDRKQFFQAELERRWSSIHRCC